LATYPRSQCFFLLSGRRRIAVKLRATALGVYKLSPPSASLCILLAIAPAPTLDRPPARLNFALPPNRFSAAVNRAHRGQPSTGQPRSSATSFEHPSISVMLAEPLNRTRPMPIVGNTITLPLCLRPPWPELPSPPIVQLSWGKRSWGLGFGLSRRLAPVLASIGRRRCSPEHGRA
jgi:hypothetical protein